MIFRIFVLSTASTLLALGVFTASGQNPHIIWLPEKLEINILQEGTRTADIVMRSSVDLHDVKIFVVPEISAYVNIAADSLNEINHNDLNNLKITINVPNGVPAGTIEGTIHILAGKKTISKPLPVLINVINVSDIEQQLAEEIIEEFGTTKPLIPDGQKFLLTPLSLEIFNTLTLESDLPFVFKLSSVIFAYNLPVDEDVTNAIPDLLLAANNKGIRVNDIISTLQNHRWHKDNIKNPILPIGEALTVFATPVPQKLFHDRDGDGRADFLLIIPDNKTHTILSPADSDEISNFDFITNIGIKESALTAIHELVHVLDFQIECGGGILWYLYGDEEDFVTVYVEELIRRIFSVAQDTTALNFIVDNTLASFPNTQNCLERLNLTRPQPSILTINSASPGSVSLSWTANENNDFSAYKLFRSTEANVTLNDTLVAEFNDRNSLAFIDDDFPGGQTFYYKLFTFDAPGLSAESNEVATVCAYTAEYFGNKDLAGPPLVTRCEPAPISYDWGTASPVPGIIPEDNFSVRWTGSFDFEDATYQFLALNDDGVRIYVDGVPIIDAWLDQASGFYFQNVPMTAGMHTVVVEHYEHFVDAHITARFIKL